MKCPEINEHLSAYLDGELEAELEREVEAHLDICEACRAERDALKQVMGMLHALPRERAPEAVEREVVGYIERDMLLQQPKRAGGPTVWRKTVGSAIVAVATVVIAVGAYIHVFREPAAPPQEDYGDFVDRSDRDADTLVEGDRKNVSGGAGGGGTRSPKGFDDMTSAQRETGTKDFRKKDATTLGLKSKSQDGQSRAAGVNGIVKDLAPVVALKEDAGKTSGEQSLFAAKMRASGKTDAAGTETRAGFEKKGRELAGIVPAQHEVLDLRITSDDIADARKRITVAAASLDIQTIEMTKLYGSAGDGYADRMERPARTPSPVAVRRGVTRGRAEERTDAEQQRKLEANADALERRTRRSRRNAGGGKRAEAEADVKAKVGSTPNGTLARELGRVNAPSMILAVPRDKYPQFIAKLSAAKLRAETGKAIAVWSHKTPDAKKWSEPGEVAGRSTFRPSGAEVAYDETARKSEARDKPTATAEPALDAARKADLAKKLAEEKEKTSAGDVAEEATPPAKPALVRRPLEHEKALAAAPAMIYIRVYFAAVAPATPAAVTTPVPDKTRTETPTPAEK